MSIHDASAIFSWTTLPPDNVHRLSVDQYHRMIDAGVLSADDSVELLDGLLFEMSPIRPPHSFVVRALSKVLARLTSGKWEVFQQQPVTLPTSEPQPDLAVARGTDADYKDRHPGPADIGLIVEVAESSLDKDRTLKQQLFAAAGIVEYWIVNIPGRQVEVLRNPSVNGAESIYQSRNVVPAGETLELILDGKRLGEIVVAEILP